MSPAKSYFTVDTSTLTAKQVAQLHEFVQNLQADSPVMALIKEGARLRSDTSSRTPAATHPTDDELFDQFARESTTAAAPQLGEWTLPAAVMLMHRLRANRNGLHAQLIETIPFNEDRDGVLTREGILEEEGLDDDAKLTRWSLPFTTAVKQLQEESRISPDLPPVVVPVRTGARVSGYRVDPQIVYAMRYSVRLFLTPDEVLPTDVRINGESPIEPYPAGHYYRMMRLGDITDRTCADTTDSECLYVAARPNFSNFTTARIHRGDGNTPGLELTDDMGRKLYLYHFNAGYAGTGPDAATAVVAREGFGSREAIKMIVEDPARSKMPLTLDITQRRS